MLQLNSMNPIQSRYGAGQGNYDDGGGIHDDDDDDDD